MQGSARKDVVFGAARVYTFTVPRAKMGILVEWTNLPYDKRWCYGTTQVQGLQRVGPFSYGATSKTPWAACHFPGPAASRTYEISMRL